MNCAYCHNADKKIELNPDIYEFLKKQPKLEKIVFSGGEPLLYKDLIDSFVTELKDTQIKFYLVSNGTLLNDNNVNWLNERNIVLGISFDGITNMRGALPNFQFLPKVNNFSGVSTVVTKKFNYDSFYQDLKVIMEETGMDLVSKPNFIHQTKDSPNLDLVDGETVDNYIQFVLQMIAFEYELLQKMSCKVDKLKISYLSLQDIKRMVELGDAHGVRCCNEMNIGMAVNGKFYLCSYGKDVVGNIYDGINWEVVEEAIPSKCKKCDIWKYCRNTCIANITENECKISKAVIHKLKELGCMEGWLDAE